jgi:predicted MFS family arabinose efflux permease
MGFYMLHNTLQVNATQMVPERRSVAVALFATAFFLGQALGVQAVGMAAAAFGTTLVISACALALAVVAGVVWLALSRRHAAGSAFAVGE